jgi:diguanylate cyclase
MRSDASGRRRAVPLFTVYAAASLVPVAVLGVLLASSYRSDTNRGAMAEARSQASLLAADVVGPQLGTAPLHGALPASTDAAIAAVFARTSGEGRLLRMRIRDMSGAVIWSDDGSGISNSAPDDEVLDAAHGETVSDLTRLNDDPNDVGPAGPRVVEIYEPINVGGAHTEVGILEIYLPYAPIQHDVTAGLRTTYELLAGGLLALWLVLAAISASTTRHLRKRAQRLLYIAHHDVASGLLNSEGFVTELRRQLGAENAVNDRGISSASARSAAVAMIDVSRFREINEALGRARGDQVLLEIGRRFAATAHEGALVARLGGDEFAVAEFADAETDLHAWARQLQEAINEPIQADGVPVLVEVAIGYDRATAGEPVDDVLVRADAALARAKSAPDNCAGYVERHGASGVALLPRFRDAIQLEQLELHYQPKTLFSDNSVTAVEALVRWNLDGGQLPPGAFVPQIEQTALIHPLTDWVARTALRQLAQWDESAPSLHVAINVSARNLSDTGFAARLLGIVADSGIAADRLIVEITETALLVDPEAARASLSTLHDAGVAISIDDFGQGQTSLAYLAALPIDELKIDRAFVSHVADPTHAAIVRSIIQLGHGLGLQVVAEGIERDAEYARLATLGADIAQGYLIARPMPADRFVDWLKARAVSESRAAS